MRGKDSSRLLSQPLSGITPAYAGKSSAFICSSPVNQDHPRLCGEKDRDFVAVHKFIGSPPPMRGKVGQLSDSVTGQWDHPRLCGEKQKTTWIPQNG